MKMLTPDPAFSDDMADSLASMHESMIALAKGLDAAYPSPLYVERIKVHVDALISLGRPRVAPDLLAKGWSYDHSMKQWVRPYTADEYPFPTEPYDHTTDASGAGRVWAEHNEHARMIDGTSSAKYLSYEPGFYVV